MNIQVSTQGHFHTAKITMSPAAGEQARKELQDLHDEYRFECPVDSVTDYSLAISHLTTRGLVEVMEEFIAAKKRVALRTTR